MATLDEQYSDRDVTGKIIGCAMEVHRVLGNGFQEVIYQRALDMEMTSQGLEFCREFEMTIYYKGAEIGTRRVDFCVAGRIMVELKAVTVLEDVHLAQAKNYLEASGMTTGLLLNFGGRSLDIKRVMHSPSQRIPRSKDCHTHCPHHDFHD